MALESRCSEEGYAGGTGRGMDSWPRTSNVLSRAISVGHGRLFPAQSSSRPAAKRVQNGCGMVAGRRRTLHNDAVRTHVSRLHKPSSSAPLFVADLRKNDGSRE